MDTSTLANSTPSTLSTVLSLVVIILLIVAYWKMFEKAGEAGWKSLIPFYSTYIEFKLFWGKGIMFLLLLVPLVNIVVYIMFCIKIAKSFGKSAVFGALIMIFPNIALLILGFGSAEYLGPNGGA